MKKLVLIIVSIFLVQSSFAQWSGMGTGPGGKVRALCVHNGELYAGGDFTGLVKKWNGSSWVAVGSLTGTTSPKVNTLISFNGTLYAGGSFTITGSNKGNVAKLSGSTWVATESAGLGGTAGSEVKCFYIWSNSLYVGGTFDQSGGSFLSKIGKFVNNTWQQVGGGGPSNCLSGVYAIAAYNNELYVGGQGSAPWINKLNTAGTAWLDMPSGGLTSGTGVYALASFVYPSGTSPSLFIGGDFANTPSSTVCVFSSGVWGTAVNTFSSGVSDQVNCFLTSIVGGGTSATGSIYAGGVFSVTGIHTATNLAKRTKTIPWDTAGTPAFNNGIRALCYFSGYLVAGGDFTVPGSYVARYATTVDVEEISDNIIVNTFYPNPIIKEALLKVQTKNLLRQPELKMLDVNGKEMMAHTSTNSFNHSQNEIEFRVDREGLAAGIYYYTVVDEERIIATGKVVIE